MRSLVHYFSTPSIESNILVLFIVIDKGEQCLSV